MKPGQCEAMADSVDEEIKLSDVAHFRTRGYTRMICRAGVFGLGDYTLSSYTMMKCQRFLTLKKTEKCLKRKVGIIL